MSETCEDCNSLECVKRAVETYLEKKVRGKGEYPEYEVWNYFRNKFAENIKFECLEEHLNRLEEEVGRGEVYAFVSDSYYDLFDADCQKLVREDIGSFFQ